MVGILHENARISRRFWRKLISLRSILADYRKYESQNKDFFKESPIVPPYSAAHFGGLRPIINLLLFQHLKEIIYDVTTAKEGRNIVKRYMRDPVKTYFGRLKIQVKF